VRRGGSGEAGLTLVELVIATFVLALAVLAVLYGMTATLASIRVGEDTAVAASLLRQAVEETKLEPFDALADVTWFGYQGMPYDVERTVTVAMTNPNAPGRAEVKQVELRVYRQPRSRYPEPVAVWTFLVYRGGI